MLKCVHCLKECKNKNSHRNHERTCPKNVDRIYKNGMSGKDPWNKGLTKEDERIRKAAETLSITMKGRPGRPFTEEQKKAKSIWRKQYHLDNPESHPNRKLAGNRKKISYPEKVAFDWLEKNNITFEHQKKIGPYYPDFVIGNLIIEIDGEYWHNQEKDKEKDCFFQELGYNVTRIKAKELIEKRLSNIFGL